MKKLLLFIFVLCSVSAAQSLKIPYTRYVLSNGLNVILHQDHSTPTVSVNTWYHVGSGHEKVGRTGFAHLFEHLMFEGSKNVAEGDFDKLLEAAGGENNGSTTQDRTNYYEDVPSNALELALYLDSDRMGYLIEAMTQEKLDGQRSVVKNERRQSYENRPYGLAYETILKHMFPQGHPYSWPVIGSMADLTAASHEDVVEFFRTYYVPNNASLVISGDIDLNETINLVEKWFGEIPAGKPVPPQNPAAVKLSEEKIVMLEDKVQLPRLYIAWITPPNFTPGDAEMDVLANILSGGKNSRLYKKLVYELQIAQDVYAYQSSGKLVSQFQVVATARSGHNLTELKNVIEQELNKIKTEAPTQRELQRVVNQYEASFLARLERPGGFSGKADLLNSYYYFTGNPDYANEDLARYKALAPEDIQFAAQKYLPNNGRVILSIVPKGKTDLAIQPKTEVK
ncbi:MAG: peptidase M16-like protein [Ignavibacteria bacterium]|nr:MAG: peptidase M16-like protein [Ignavibacteria bacterium]KAF0156137.1 MAG: peptidase M16-like protein [Ignavibacteria bacterium]